LKYFGVTTQKDPYKYQGSGINWKRHLFDHKSYAKTIKIYTFLHTKNARKFALKFSKQNNIVKSKKWANLVSEDAIRGTKHKSNRPVIIDVDKYFMLIIVGLGLLYFIL
jgi:hypothetical protein